MRHFPPGPPTKMTPVEPDLPRALADLLEVSGLVDRACKEMPLPSAQLIEASRAIHLALLALNDWCDVTIARSVTVV
jgi:hypothetical protein